MIKIDVYLLKCRKTFKKEKVVPNHTETKTDIKQTKNKISTKNDQNSVESFSTVS